mgnify:CR=1 FL=1
MKLYDISGEQFSAMDAPRHLMTEEGTAQTTLDRSLGICQVAELEGKSDKRSARGGHGRRP